MTARAIIAEGRRHSFVSKLGRRASQLLRTKTLTPRAPTPLVSFTFDDIPDSAAENGAAVLDQHDAKGTFYVAAGLCGLRYNEWTFASGETVAALAARGHEIGCHTFSHPDIQNLGPRALETELERNAAAMQLLAPGVRMTNFSYPYGSAALRQKQAVQRRFRSARGTRQGINVGPIDLGQLLAVRLYDHLIGPAGLDALIRDTVAARGWLVFYTHDVVARPSLHGCTPSLIAMALEAARRHDCAVVTVEAALDRLAA